MGHPGSGGSMCTVNAIFRELRVTWYGWSMGYEGQRKIWNCRRQGQKTVCAMVRSLDFVLKSVGNPPDKLSPVDISSKWEGEQSKRFPRPYCLEIHTKSLSMKCCDAWGFHLKNLGRGKSRDHRWNKIGHILIIIKVRCWAHLFCFYICLKFPTLKVYI